MSGQKLFAGPWVGEFGVELAWAAAVRYAARYYEHVTVCTFEGRDAIYADFADEVTHHGFAGICVGADIRGPGAPSKEEIAALVPRNVALFPPRALADSGNEFQGVGNQLVWVKYGEPQEQWDDVIVLHARARSDWGGARNWPAERWTELAGKLRRTGRRLVSIGSTAEALLVEGSEDARDLPLRDVMDILASAHMCLGPSSGPMHLAALCACPHLVWYGGDENALHDDEACKKKIRTLDERYYTAWNPHHAPVYRLVAANWRPGVTNVIDCYDRLSAHVSGTIMAPTVRDAEIEVIVPEQRPGRHTRRPRIGVCILSYEQPELLREALLSVRRRTLVAADICVFDNSKNGRVAEMVTREFGRRVTLFKPPTNLGCTKPRNFFLRYCRAKGYPHAVFMDQDVEVTAAGWLRDMRKVAQRHADTGMVAWPLANQHKVFGGQETNRYEPDETGAVPEVPGLCCLHVLDAIEETARRVEPPYCEEMFTYRFDTLACLILAKAGYKTRIVPGQNKIAHNHPHSGVNLIPDLREQRAHSRRVLRRKMYDLGLQEVPGLL